MIFTKICFQVIVLSWYLQVEWSVVLLISVCLHVLDCTTDKT